MIQFHYKLLLLIPLYLGNNILIHAQSPEPEVKYTLDTIIYWGDCGSYWIPCDRTRPDSIKDGYWVEYQDVYCRKEGSTTSEKHTYRISEGTYKGGKKIGTWQEYDHPSRYAGSECKIQIRSVLNKHVVSIDYYEDGSVSWKGYFGIESSFNADSSHITGQFVRDAYAGHLEYTITFECKNDSCKFYSSGELIYSMEAIKEPIELWQTFRHGVFDEELEKANSNQETEIFMIVEDMPRFPRGECALKKYLANIPNPADEQGNRIEGNVWVQFIIDREGSVTDAEILRGTDPTLDEVALERVRSMPKWSPGRHRGRAVLTLQRVKISFAMTRKEERKRKKLERKKARSNRKA